MKQPLPTSYFPLPCSRRTRFRRGSALLIVLGMLAFMVISAVAFSAYMRYSRLPSSYLRRSSASRLLVKAALAEAIDEIDSAIGNNPHPGIGSNAYMYNDDDNSRAKGSSVNRNTWKNRIYIGSSSISGGGTISGEKGLNATSGSNVSGFVDPDETVSTLTLEGLAYIPPALVNDARYYSRRSKAGQWKNLAFDAGRYAFCAIDVSDYLNVNALMADAARAGSADRRISLSYLFEGDGHSSAETDASAWDGFMEKFSGSGKVPLVSLADYNLALYDQKPTGWTSVFCDYVNPDKNSGNSFYGGIGPNSAEADKIRRQAFVTDSFFPDGDEHEEHGGGHGADGHLDLDEEDAQPFTKSELRANKTLIQVADENLANAEAFKKYEQCIDPIGFCQLYDYLDKNDEPVSLAVPTVERVPMICGLSPEMANATLTITPNIVQNNVIAPVGGTATVGGQYTITLQVKYEISGLPTAPMTVVAAYPFRHESKQNKSFQVGGRMAYFLTIDGNNIGLRTKSTADILHIGYKPTISPTTPIDDAVYAVDFSPRTLSSSAFSAGSSGPQGAVTKFSLTPNGAIPSTITFLDVTYVDKGTYIPNPSQTGPPAIPDPTHSTVQPNSPDFAISGTPTCKWKPLDANGRVDAAFNTALATTLANPSYTAKFKLNLAVWAWVKNGNRYVDMVPACVHDDTDLNDRNAGRSQTWGQEHLGRAYPLMRFDMSNGGAPAMAFNVSQVNSALTADTGASMAVTPQAVMVCDPRFNHAPESWFQVAGNITESTWLDNCECGYKTTGNGTRDGDIFMATSDNEELQSVFELANLLRFTAFYKSGAKYGSKSMNYAAPDVFYTGTSFPAQAKDTANFGYMWRTYDPFDGDDFEGVGIHASCEGYKLTPYSTQTNVMMAAFANTPHEWALSSANEQTMNAIPDDAKGFNAKYAWNAYSSGAKIDWEDLEELCGVFMEEMRLSNGTKDWEDVWRDLDWTDFNKSGEERSKYLLNDLPLTDTSMKGRIWNCDRKFLYGFWHDCFALKQQLFLVFVRAEPMMMGGGAVGQTPPALGARAVALVWRDPTKTSNNNDPHQTRVLFYRQFD